MLPLNRWMSRHRLITDRVSGLRQRHY